MFINEINQGESMKRLNYMEQTGINEVISEIQSVDKKLYNEKIFFGMAFYKTGDTLKPSFGIVKFFEKGTPLPIDVEYHYDDFIIIRKGISYEDLLDVMNKIKEGSEITIPSGLKFTSKLDSWQSSYVFSNQDWGYIEHEYPGKYFQSNFTAGTNGSIPNYAIAGKDIPPYPNGERALQHIFGLKHLWQLQLMFVINIPDFSAKIDSLKISDKEIHVEVRSNHISEDDLRIQYYVSGEGSTTTNQSIKLRDGVIKLENEPNEILIILIDKNGNVIDKKHTSLQYVEGDPSIRIETPSFSILQMISLGEGKHIEFKSKLGNPEPFVESIVAFANTEGGRILVGVDNNSNRVKGFGDPNKIKETVTNWISEFCDPKVDAHFEYSEELDVLIIGVPEGKDKPYDLKGKGPFLRVGATNRIASRTERDNMSRRDNVAHPLTL